MNVPQSSTHISNTYNITTSSSKNRIEVTKANPCVNCGRPNQCYVLSDGLIACKKIGLKHGDKLPEGYVWTNKTDREGTYYIATKESQQRYKEQNKAQY